MMTMTEFHLKTISVYICLTLGRDFVNTSKDLPTVRVEQPSYSVTADYSVTLVCNVTSSLPITRVYWKKEVGDIITTISSNTNTNKYSGSTTSQPSLTILHAAQIDEGSYQCFATNSNGTGESTKTTLSVTPNTCSGVSHYFGDTDETVNFPPVSSGSHSNSSEICITDKNPLATASCIGVQGNPPVFKNFVLNSKCMFADIEKSGSTEALENLTKVTINEENVRSVVESIKNITTTSEQNLTSYDIIIVTDVIGAVVKNTTVDEETATDIVDIVDKVIDIKEEVIENAQDRGSATNRILEVLESIQLNVDLQNKSSIQIRKPNIIMDIYETSAMESPVIGIQIEGDNNQPLTTSDIDTLFPETNITVNSLDAAIILPLDIIKENSTRISLSIYKNLKLFSVSSDKDQYLPNSRVIAASMSRNGVNIRYLGGYPVRTIFFPRRNESVINECGYWNYSINDNSGGWATDGCFLNGTESGRLLCFCDHLTNFAVLMNIGGQDTLEEGLAIQIITWIGLVLSITGLSLTVLSFLLFRHLRKGRAQQTILGLAISLLCFLFVFAVGIKQTQDIDGCTVVAILLHYFILVAFMWMLIEGILQYLSFVKVLGTYIPNFIPKAAAFAWGLPVIPVIIVLSINYDLYQGGTKACWMSLSAFYYAFVIPVAIIIAANIIIFILILKNLFWRPKGLTSNQCETKMAKTNLKAGFSILVLLGLTWIFGFFTIEEASVVFQYIFTILNVFQGFVIFLLFTARQEHVRDEWKTLCCKGKQKDKYMKRNISSDQGGSKSSVLSAENSTYDQKI